MSVIAESCIQEVALAASCDILLPGRLLGETAVRQASSIVERVS